MRFRTTLLVLLAWLCIGPHSLAEERKLPLEIAGVRAVPHVRAGDIRYDREPAGSKGSLFQLFLRNDSDTPQPGHHLPEGVVHTNEMLFNGLYPLRLLMDGEWSWHDTPNGWHEKDTALPPGAVMAVTFNANHSNWSPGSRFRLTVRDWELQREQHLSVRVPDSSLTITSITFLGSGASAQPDKMSLYVENRSGRPQRIARLQLYFPESGARHKVFLPGPTFKNYTTMPLDRVVPPGEKGALSVETGLLPLGYALIELTLVDPKEVETNLFVKVRIRREQFDIGGGWIAGAARDGKSFLAHEPVLKTYRRLHINQGHFGNVPGYTDQTGPAGLYTRYSMRRFERFEPLSAFDTDAVLPTIHAAESLGEPQLAFSKDQKLPQQVFDDLGIYRGSRIPSSITLNDESTWRFYAGLSDYPHFDAYRVTAPSVDNFRLYDRWGKTRIGWGAPLEGIGSMTRSLREMSRPSPTAVWSQGPANGWEVYDGRSRTAPTPDEMRVQAYHALANRITSLYWFNPSVPSMVKFRDLLSEMGRIGRECRLLERFYLEGDSYEHKRLSSNRRLDWDISSIVAPFGAVLFAVDLDYRPNPKTKEFEFSEPRASSFSYRLPVWLRDFVSVVKIGRDGPEPVEFTRTIDGVRVADIASKVGIYVVVRSQALVEEMAGRWRRLLEEENSIGFDPAASDVDFEVLKSLVPKR